MDSIDTVLKQLAQHHNCSENEILIAFDESEPEDNKIDTYLRQKLESDKYSNLNEIRKKVLKGGEIKQELVVGFALHRWNGDIAILFGGPQMELRKKIHGELHNRVAVMGAENLLIVGPRAKLEQFKTQYGDKIVYLEDLSIGQKDAFKVPDRLR